MDELQSSKPLEVFKAWIEGNDTIIEGWVSTDSVDLDHHKAPPESFVESLPEYFQRNAPISDTHDFGPHPRGHHQRGALLRDGKVLLEVEHPTDPAPFKNLPTSGTGWWGRARITHPVTAGEINKGNMAGFSWTGIVQDHHKEGDITVFDRVYPLRESCVAAYPRNTKAIFQVSKATVVQQGAEPTSDVILMSPDELERQNKEVDENTLESLLMKVLDKREAARSQEVQKAAENEEIVAVKAQNAELRAQIEKLTSTVSELGEEVKKAQIPARGEGVGSKQIVKTNEEMREENPVEFVVQKAQKPDELEPLDKELIRAWTVQYLYENLQYDPKDR